MRPVLRGDSPQADDFTDYRAAFNPLAARIGMFCSYCERRIATQLAVEHIQPKSLPQYERFNGRWDNFLLACVNCNSTKGNKDVVLADVLLPDRDNTAVAFEYAMDGRIIVPDRLTVAQRAMARRTLALVGLDRSASNAVGPNGRLVAIDRVAQRMEAWLIAQSSKDDLRLNPSDAFRRQIARTATACGHFSIWMTVFRDDSAVQKMLIDEFPGTAKDCFDPNMNYVIPRPATGLADGSKV